MHKALHWSLYRVWFQNTCSWILCSKQMWILPDLLFQTLSKLHAFPEYRLLAVSKKTNMHNIQMLHLFVRQYENILVEILVCKGKCSMDDYSSKKSRNSLHIHHFALFFFMLKLYNVHHICVQSILSGSITFYLVHEISTNYHLLMFSTWSGSTS